MLTIADSLCCVPCSCARMAWRWRSSACRSLFSSTLATAPALLTCKPGSVNPPHSLIVLPAIVLSASTSAHSAFAGLASYVRCCDVCAGFLPMILVASGVQAGAFVLLGPGCNPGMNLIYKGQ